MVTEGNTIARARQLLSIEGIVENEDGSAAIDPAELNATFSQLSHAITSAFNQHHKRRETLAKLHPRLTDSAPNLGHDGSLNQPVAQNFLTSSKPPENGVNPKTPSPPSSLNAAARSRQRQRPSASCVTPSRQKQSA